jgi:hypothetical protein
MGIYECVHRNLNSLLKHLKLVTSISFGTLYMKCSMQIYHVSLCLMIVLINYHGNPKYVRNR